MTTYARKLNNIATDVVTSDPFTLFHPAVAAQFIVVPDGTQDGWVYNGAWGAPVIAAPVQQYETKIPRQEFFMLFTQAERVNIRASSDAGVRDFLDIIMDLSNTAPPVIVDVGRPEVIEAINYLETVPIPNSSPSQNLLTTDRVATILLGRPII